jgi:hypothetical protein
VCPHWPRAPGKELPAWMKRGPGWDKNQNQPATFQAGDMGFLHFLPASPPSKEDSQALTQAEGQNPDSEPGPLCWAQGVALWLHLTGKVGQCPEAQLHGHISRAGWGQKQ